MDILMNPSVLAAIDLGPSSPRVLHHAAGFARLLSARMVIIHISSDNEAQTRQRVLDYCIANGPYEVDPSGCEIVVRRGCVSEAINREAIRGESLLIVMGARGHGGLAQLLLGSTSEAVLRGAATPVLLVPPIDLEIVNITDRAALTCGPILAPIDLGEDCSRQLALASRLAGISGQPLLLMTVAASKLSDRLAGQRLHDRGHGLAPVRPQAAIVRRGSVPEEISACAAAEESGLVVMGLRAQSRGRAGRIASAVLKSKRTFVLAVPGVEGRA